MAVQGQAVVGQAVAVGLGHLVLQRLDVVVAEFIHASALQADQVVMVRPLMSSNTALPLSKVWRSSRPAASSCDSTR